MEARLTGGRRVACLFVTLAFFGAGGSAAAGSGWPRVARLADGSTVSVGTDGRVVERDRDGRVSADSVCGSYAVYARWVSFMRAFQVALGRRDRGRVAADVHYPLLAGGQTIGGRQQLLSRYDAVFSHAVVRAILASDPRELFCQNVSQVMLGSGAVWGDAFGGRLAIITVNPPVL